MARQIPLDPGRTSVLSMTRPVPDWTGQILEYFFLLGTTLWLGVHGSTALLTAPLLTRSGAVSLEIARVMVWLLETLGYAASIAVTLLLLTTLGMYIIRLRSPRAILLQLGLILFMAAAALGPHVWLLPKLNSLLRVAALSPEALAPESGEIIARATAGLGGMGLIHLFSGAILVSLAARRCYHYPDREEMPCIAGHDA